MIIIAYWYLAMLAEGLACMPLARFIFRRFTDRGWMFAKTTGLFLTAWLLWLSNCTHVLPFLRDRAFLAVAVTAAVNYSSLIAAAVFRRIKNPGKRPDFPKLNAYPTVLVIVLEEALFFLIFASAVYVIGFRPEAYGTEKFMDYGFMTSMMRSLYMPFADPWYAGSPVNYYYGGQYIAAFLTKLTGVTAGEGYNLMRGLITAFSFVLPFSLVRQMLNDRMDAYMQEGRSKGAAWRPAFEIGDTGKKYSALSAALSGGLPVLGGILAGIGTAFSGNYHYVIYGLIKPAVSSITGVSCFYWFPDSTRFIGYDPDIPDKTIHEFPAYSTVLGDLHAHYINIIFVLTVTAIVYGWAQKHDSDKNARRSCTAPEVLLIGFMTGVFRWTNFWDFPIYFVVCGSIFFFVMLRTYGKNLKKFPADILILAAVMFIAGYAGAYPFTASFDQISSEIALTHSHTSLYQLAVLWGVPAVYLLIFAVKLLGEWFSRVFSEDSSENAAKPARMALPDLAALLFGLCAAGLVFLPEVIYVKDIYGDAHYRANTMFKLTYQAFILFAVSMAYIAVRLIMSYAAVKYFHPADELSGPFTQPPADNAGVPFELVISQSRRPGKGQRTAVCGTVMSVLILITGTYTTTAIRSWVGDITDPSLRVSTDASVFISEYYPEDLKAVCWINSHISGQPVILEAPGDSYSDSCRISVATGLPTVIGWSVHEWLWRNDPDAVFARMNDCDAIYEAKDANEARALLEKYDVKYIYIGELEREMYPTLSEELLKGLGKVVFEDGEGTFVVEVG